VSRLDCVRAFNGSKCLDYSVGQTGHNICGETGSHGKGLLQAPFVEVLHGINIIHSNHYTWKGMAKCCVNAHVL